MRDQILRFWSGEPIGVSYVKSAMKDLGIPHRGSMKTMRARQFGFQRFGFASRLARAAGYKGWVWLIDETELIASYSLLQRMRSYSQIGALLKDNSPLDCPGVVSVLTISEDFDTSVIEERQDAALMMPYFRTRLQSGLEDPSFPPKAGISEIQSSGILLEPVRDSNTKHLYAKVRELYRAAYDWEPPQQNQMTFPGSTTVRQMIKYWITLWDIERLIPTSDGQLEAVHLDYDYHHALIDDDHQANEESLVDETLRVLGLG
jgi:hypothetical protein